MGFKTSGVISVDEKRMNKWFEKMNTKPSFKAISITTDDMFTQLLYEISEDEISEQDA